MTGRTLAKATLFIGLVLLGSVVSLNPNNYAPTVTSLIVRSAHQHGVYLRVTEPQLSWRSYEARRAEITPPGTLLSIAVSDPRVSMAWLRLLFGKIFLSSSGRLYGGIFSAQAWRGVWSDQLALVVRATDIALGQLPPLLPFGVTGSVALEGDASFNLSKPSTPTGQVRLAVRDGKKALSTKLDLGQFGLPPFQIDIPAFSDLNLDIAVSAEGNTLTSKQLQLRSSLVNANGNATMLVNPRSQPPHLQLELSIELTSAGLALAGPMLPLISANKLSSTTNRFSLRLEGLWGRAQPEFQAL